MKTKTENKKFSLEKFEVAKLKNMTVIKGGSAVAPGTKDDDHSITDRVKDQSSEYC
jgi:hypothetical protein